MTIANTFNAIKGLLQTTKVSQCQNATITVHEKGRQATLKTVHIVSVGASAFSIKYDECGFPGQTMFATHPSLHRACDAIAFCEVDGDPYVMFFELKSSEPSRHEVAEQFRSAHCFLEYLDVLLQQYCSCSSIRTWKRRYFVFHNQSPTPLSKRPSVDSFDNTSPERALFVPVTSGQKTYIRKLLGKNL